MGSHCEVIRDKDGTVLARVQLTGPPTDELRDALVALVKHARTHFAKTVDVPAPAGQEGTK